MLETILEKADEKLYEFFLNNKEIMPKRIGKWLALYFTDARIRKHYSSFIGVKMGDRTFANLGLKVTPNESPICVHIGNNVSIAPNVTFICCSNANNGQEINSFDHVKNVLTKSGDITIEDEVWIGANVTILPGVRVGRCSVIGACSLVIDDVTPYSIYAGIPAKKIRDLKTGERVQN